MFLPRLYPLAADGGCGDLVLALTPKYQLVQALCRLLLWRLRTIAIAEFARTWTTNVNERDRLS